LITATLLTLFVLPCLYMLFASREGDGKPKAPSLTVVLAIAAAFSLLPNSRAQAQAAPLSLQDYINMALQHNLNVRTASLEVEQGKAMTRSSFDPGKANLMLTQDPTSGGNIDNALGITQSFALPGLYKHQKNVLRQQTLLAERSQQLTRAEVIRDVKTAYYNYVYGMAKIKVLDYLDSVYLDFSRKAEVRQRTGETSNLERLTAQNKYQEIQLLRKEAQAELNIYELSLQQLINTGDAVTIREDSLHPIPFLPAADTAAGGQHPLLDYYDQHIRLAGSKVKLERARMLPEITLGYNHQLIIGGFNPANIDRKYFPGTRIAGFQLGLGLPLFMGSYKAKVNAERIGVAVAQSRLAATRQQLEIQRRQQYREYLKYKQSVDYYLASGLRLADEQIRVAQFAFSKGEIGYVEFIQNLSLAVQTKLNYLAALNQQNNAVIKLQYLQGNQQ
jgi:cobalt-zinc-cadmium resistance protein CzcA